MTCRTALLRRCVKSTGLHEAGRVPHPIQFYFARLLAVCQHAYSVRRGYVDPRSSKYVCPDRVNHSFPRLACTSTSTSTVLAQRGRMVKPSYGVEAHLRGETNLLMRAIQSASGCTLRCRCIGQERDTAMASRSCSPSQGRFPPKTLGRSFGSGLFCACGRTGSLTAAPSPTISPALPC